MRKIGHTIMYKSREDVGSWIYVAFCKHTNKSCRWSSDKSKEISQRIKMKRSTKICNMLGTWPLRKKCLYSELFWSAGSRIQTEYGEIRSISPYSAGMREKATQNNFEYGHFLRSGLCRKNFKVIKLTP